MYRESFEILREIASLLNYVKQSTSSIEDHKERLKKFEQKITDNQLSQKEIEQQMTECRKKRVELESLYAKHQNHLEKAKEHLNMATSQAQMDAGEKELARLEADIENCDNQLFNLMEQEEQLDENVKQKVVELQGLQESLQEIRVEVEDSIAKENENIVGFKIRIEALEQQLHSEVLKVYKNLIQHHCPPFSEVDKGRCSECAIQVPANIEQAINSAQSLEHCGGCGRLFLVR
jgi:predicted  nucleic acid-binding Zn-ribbon protein